MFLFGSWRDKIAIRVVAHYDGDGLGVHVVGMTMGAEEVVEVGNLFGCDGCGGLADVIEFFACVFGGEGIGEVGVDHEGGVLGGEEEASLSKPAEGEGGVGGVVVEWDGVD